MKTLESIFSRTAQFGLLIYLAACFGLFAFLLAAIAKWLKLIDVIQYIAFAFGLGLLALLIGMVGLSLLGIRQNCKHKEAKHV
jgi:O-antigen/teichoic acid export membrane protein